jgi:hypothetical protein
MRTYKIQKQNNSFSIQSKIPFFQKTSRETISDEKHLEKTRFTIFSLCERENTQLQLF